MIVRARLFWTAQYELSACSIFNKYIMRAHSMCKDQTLQTHKMCMCSEWFGANLQVWCKQVCTDDLLLLLFFFFLCTLCMVAVCTAQACFTLYCKCNCCTQCMFMHCMLMRATFGSLYYYYYYSNLKFRNILKNLTYKFIIL